MNNPHPMQEMKDNNQREIANISIVCSEIFSELQGLLKCWRWAF
jgi:hypothetical protein